MTDDILDVWQFGREDERAVATVVALDRLSPPDFRVALLIRRSVPFALVFAAYRASRAA